MRSNACRRATFDVTIENMQMEIWFASGSHTREQTIQLFTEPEHLIHSWSLAVANVHELSPSRFEGGGARTFEARLKSEDGRLVKNAEPVVLKASWRDSDREREDKISEQIIADLQKKQGIEKEGEPRKYSLSAFAEENVMVDGKIDGTDSSLHGSNLPADCTSYLSPAGGSPRLKPTRTGEGLTPNFPCIPNSTKQSKVCQGTHSDLVFQGAYQPIYEPRSRDTLLVTLQDARTALKFLRGVDLVYHDVSAGDVLPTAQICELADLEYAKHMDSDTERGLLTGTLGFMACEVEAQDYLYKCFQKIDKDSLDKWLQVPFRFNPLHDVESIWWIATWILYYHVDQEGDQPSPDQTEYFHKLFPGRLGVNFVAFSASKKFRVLPTSLHRAAHVVASMCMHLKRAYSASELSDERLDYTEPLAKLHSDFIGGFKSIIEHSAGIRLFRPTVKHPHQEDPFV
ncbi:hypothetical protein EDD15DRAFT_2367147 [Pisolithus albus]|nr:hypothetical protein EDD15DRAFT_2367147 [Pisolithus albus]